MGNEVKLTITDVNGKEKPASELVVEILNEKSPLRSFDIYDAIKQRGYKLHGRDGGDLGDLTFELNTLSLNGVIMKGNNLFWKVDK